MPRPPRRDGKADMIFGIYYNDERATYLDYVQPAFIFDDVVGLRDKDKKFPFTGQDDLIGKKGVTNQGESYGNDFDAFIKDKLDGRPHRRHRRRLQGADGRKRRLSDRRLLSGPRRGGQSRAEGRGRAARAGAALGRDVRRLLQEVALQARSAPQFGEGITAMTTDGSFDKMLTDAIAAWDAKNTPKE